VQSVSITTKGVSSNPVHGEVYSIQHYVIERIYTLYVYLGLCIILSFRVKQDDNQISFNITYLVIFVRKKTWKALSFVKLSVNPCKMYTNIMRIGVSNKLVKHFVHFNFIVHKMLY
jgi:hypothetical protein